MPNDRGNESQQPQQKPSAVARRQFLRFWERNKPPQEAQVSEQPQEATEADPVTGTLLTRRQFNQVAVAASVGTLTPSWLRPEATLSPEDDWSRDVIKNIIPERDRAKYLKETAENVSGIRVYGAKNPVKDPQRLKQIFAGEDILVTGVRPEYFDRAQKREWIQHLREQKLLNPNRRIVLLVSKAAYDTRPVSDGFSNYPEEFKFLVQLYNETVQRDLGQNTPLAELATIVVMDNSLYDANGQNENLGPSRKPENNELWHQVRWAGARMPVFADLLWSFDVKYARFQPDTVQMHQYVMNGKSVIIDDGIPHDLGHAFGALGDLDYYNIPKFNTSTRSGYVSMTAFGNDIMNNTRERRFTAASKRPMMENLKRGLRSVLVSEVPRVDIPDEITFKVWKGSRLDEQISLGGCNYVERKETEEYFINGNYKSFPDQARLVRNGSIVLGKTELAQAFPYIMLGVNQDLSNTDDRRRGYLPVPRFVADLITYASPQGGKFSYDVHIMDSFWNFNAQENNYVITAHEEKELTEILMKNDPSVVAWLNVPKTGVNLVWKRNVPV